MSDAGHYQANLAGDKVAIHDAQPRVGYYKARKHKNAAWLPVCVFMHEGELVCRWGPAMVDVNDAWLYCAGHPVPKADALFAFDNNGVWPGDAPAPIGDNQPPSDDPFEQLTRDVEAEAARVRAWISEPHEGKTAADLAANWLTALRRLEDRTEAAFDIEKAPALTESKRIDVKWRGLKALAEQIKRQMSDAYDAIARKERQRLQAAADAKAREEAEARRIQWEKDRAEKEALAEQHGIHLEAAEPAPPPVIEAPPVKVAYGGAQGSRIAPKKLPATGLVEDWAKAAAHYSGSPKLREVIQKLVNQDARNGVAVPGVKVIPGD